MDQNVRKPALQLLLLQVDLLNEVVLTSVLLSPSSASHTGFPSSFYGLFLLHASLLSSYLSRHHGLAIFPIPGRQQAETEPIVGCQPSTGDVAEGISCLILLQSLEQLIFLCLPGLLFTSYYTYVISLMVLNSRVWAVYALRCEK